MKHLKAVNRKAVRVEEFIAAEGVDGGASLVEAAEHAAGGDGGELHPVEFGHVHFFDGLQGGFVVAFAVVMVKEDEVIPAGMMAVEIECALGESDAALPLAGEGEHDGHVGPSGT